jgi:AcrR family transcriptional regulator
MAEARKPRAATREKRHRLLDAAEEIMLKDGYAAVSSRSVAAAMGINPSGVHYYFQTIDDLFVALMQRRAGRNLERMEAALRSPEPLRAWWTLASDPRGTALFAELMAAANHRPALKAEVGEVARRMRAMQMERLETLLDEYDVDPAVFPPVLVAAAMHGLAFGVVHDLAAGYDTQPEAAAEAMQRLLDRLEERRATSRSG